MLDTSVISLLWRVISILPLCVSFYQNFSEVIQSVNLSGNSQFFSGPNTLFAGRGLSAEKKSPAIFKHLFFFFSLLKGEKQLWLLANTTNIEEISMAYPSQISRNKLLLQTLVQWYAYLQSPIKNYVLKKNNKEKGKLVPPPPQEKKKTEEGEGE
jgi:hypothetical protein